MGVVKTNPHSCQRDHADRRAASCAFAMLA
jgi:hypothetical protein